MSTFYFFPKAYLFWLCWVFVAVSGLSPVEATVYGLLSSAFSCLGAQGLECAGFRSDGPGL